MPDKQRQATREGKRTSQVQSPEGPDPLQAIAAQLTAFAENARIFATAKVDAAKARARNAVLTILAWLFASMLAVTLAIISSVYLARGLAGGLTEAFGGRQWVGSLLTGIMGLAFLATVAGVSIRMSRVNRLRKTVSKYEQRRARLQARLEYAAERAANEAA